MRLVRVRLAAILLGSRGPRERVGPCGWWAQLTCSPALASWAGSRGIVRSAGEPGPDAPMGCRKPLLGTERLALGWGLGSPSPAVPGGIWDGCGSS